MYPLLALVCSWLALEEPPKALQQMVEHLSRIENGRMEIEVLDQKLNAQTGSVGARKKIVRFTKGETIVEDLGDEEGVVMRMIEEHKPSTIDGYTPRLSFEGKGVSIGGADNPLSIVHVFARPVRTDYRTLGATANGPGGELRDRVLGRADAEEKAKFDERREGEFVVISSRQDNCTTTYWLDTRRDLAPVRVRFEYEDKWWNESRSMLEKRDGVWYPALVEVFTSHYRDGVEPEQVYRVRTGEFNHSDHPREFSPADIGMEPAMLVMYETKPNTPMLSGRWDGEKGIPEMEFCKLLNSGKVKEGPAFLAEIKRRSLEQTVGPIRDAASRSRKPADSIASKTIESPWELFVREFIRAYQLDVEQSQKAYLILAECQDRARQYVDRHESELAPFFASDKKVDKDRSKDNEKLLELLKPIDEIYSKELRPRLERLPTRAQQQKAAENPIRIGKGER